MPFIWSQSQHLAERSLYNNDWSGGARWAFFAIFLVVIILCVIGTIRVNKARSRRGVLPIYGTRWMTPPSYYQSQDQYNQPTNRDPEMPNAYVPTYTATANDNDMGFYDESGTFHPNPNAKGPGLPEQVHQRSSSNANGIPATEMNNRLHTVDDEETNDLRRPSVIERPPGAEASASANEFSRPNHPPPTL